MLHPLCGEAMTSTNGVPWGHLPGMPLGGTLVLVRSSICKISISSISRDHPKPIDHCLCGLFFSPGNGTVVAVLASIGCCTFGAAR